ncbi:MAG: iron export ABC transporter permease subunit FetB [Planctomycetes bacterium]|nr:iron export ABC transporter permease subunit FetB [Planctomycetota bacterium]
MLAATAIDLATWQVAISGVLVLAAGVISVVLDLRLEKKLAIAAARTVLQLALIGYALGWVFQVGHWWSIPIVVLIMFAVAGRAAVKRSSRRVRGMTVLAFVALVASGMVTIFTITFAVIGVQPWYTPQYLIPLLGMALGNGLTGISLCVDQMLDSLTERRGEVEMELSLGATRWEAARGPLADAVRRGMIPIINSMMVVGVVSLPGMMTGQIIAGQIPVEAVKYQIMVMFMIAGATSMGCILMGLMIYRRLFNARHQLLVDRIHKQSDA